MDFRKDLLKIDAEKVADDLALTIKRQIKQDLKKTGAVIGISGGIDSSVVVALCVKALGKDKVLGVIMPETESSPDSKSLAEDLADELGIETVVNNIAPALEGFGCYKLRDEAIKSMYPEFSEGDKIKIVIGSNPLEKSSINFFNLVVNTKDGQTITKRMPPSEYMQIVSASNFKQRSRTSYLYYHAERLNRAVAGTGNKDEHELGFFVKYGDGGADLKPIAHLFKLQVFQLAEVLPIPEEIRKRIPTTDTYSSEVTQTEFFFGIEFDILDPVWYGMENGFSAEDVARGMDLTEEQVTRIYKDIQQKKRGTRYLRMEPLEVNS